MIALEGRQERTYEIRAVQVGLASQRYVCVERVTGDGEKSRISELISRPMDLRFSQTPDFFSLPSGILPKALQIRELNTRPFRCRMR